MCKEQFYGERAADASVLMTRPLDIKYEIFVFQMYLNMMLSLHKEWLEPDTTLE